MKLENIREKKVYIELDKKREIRFDLNALAEFEETSGKDFFSALEALSQKKSLFALKIFLYSALKSEDDALTLKQVGSLIKIKQLKEVKSKVIEAINASLTDQEDEIKTNSTCSLGPAGKKS